MHQNKLLEFNIKVSLTQASFFSSIFRHFLMIPPRNYLNIYKSKFHWNQQIVYPCAYPMHEYDHDNNNKQESEANQD